MENKKSYISAVVCVIGLAALIVDTKTAVQGATEGIQLCLQTVIPSLFPFIFLTTMLLPSIGCIKLLRPLGRFCGIPKGSESILLMGFLGGYPIGAQTIASTWKENSLSTTSARRMLGFCSNAGPSFLFGMGAALFDNTSYVWIIWFIHIISALLVGMILPDKQQESGAVLTQRSVNAVTALKTSIQVMSRICGWVVLFKILLTFLNRWILCYFPMTIRVLIIGFIELSNGFISTNLITNLGLRIIIIAMIVGFGGLSVLFQTLSVTDRLGIGYYFPGKIMQSVISFLMAYIVQLIIMPADESIILPVGYIIGALFLLTIVILCLYGKKTVAFWKKIRYTIGNRSEKEKTHVVS